MLCGMTEIRGAHVIGTAALWLQTVMVLTAGEIGKLRGNFCAVEQWLLRGQRSDEAGEPRSHNADGWLRPNASVRVRGDLPTQDNHAELTEA